MIVVVVVETEIETVGLPMQILDKTVAVEVKSPVVSIVVVDVTSTVVVTVVITDTNDVSSPFWRYGACELLRLSLTGHRHCCCVVRTARP